MFQVFSISHRACICWTGAQLNQFQMIHLFTDHITSCLILLILWYTITSQRWFPNRSVRQENNQSVNRRIVVLSSYGFILNRCTRKCVFAANFTLTLKIIGFGRVVVYYWVSTPSTQCWGSTYIKVRAITKNKITFSQECGTIGGLPRKEILKGPNGSGRTVKNMARIVDKWAVKMWVNS